MNDKTNTYRVDIASEWRNVLKTPANLHLLMTQLSVLRAMAEEDAIAERDAARAEVVTCHQYLDECFINAADEAEPIPLVERLATLIAELAAARAAQAEWRAIAEAGEQERNVIHAVLEMPHEHETR